VVVVVVELVPGAVAAGVAVSETSRWYEKHPSSKLLNAKVVTRYETFLMKRIVELLLATFSDKSGLVKISTLLVIISGSFCAASYERLRNV
jgi:hypothetical protein